MPSRQNYEPMYRSFKYCKNSYLKGKDFYTKQEISEKFPYNSKTKALEFQGKISNFWGFKAHKCALKLKVCALCALNKAHLRYI